MEKSVDFTDHGLDPATRDRVSRLARKCCSEKPEMRPSASEIITSLQRIRSISHTGEMSNDPDKSLPPTPIEPEDLEADHILSPQCTTHAGDLPQEDQSLPMQLEDDKVYLPPDVPLFSPHPAPSYTQYYPNLPQSNGTVPIYPPCGAIWQEASPASDKFLLVVTCDVLIPLLFLVCVCRYKSAPTLCSFSIGRCSASSAV